MSLRWYFNDNLASWGMFLTKNKAKLLAEYLDFGTSPRTFFSSQGVP